MVVVDSFLFFPVGLERERVKRGREREFKRGRERERESLEE